MRMMHSTCLADLGVAVLVSPHPKLPALATPHTRSDGQNTDSHRPASETVAAELSTCSYGHNAEKSISAFRHVTDKVLS
jgi:hypothetical protein